jgi:uncharacterized protein YbaR (Trm112 family)
MPSPPSRPPAFNASILDQLACPACIGALRLDANRLLCAGCERSYPIIDGIPVLIPSRADVKPA